MQKSNVFEFESGAVQMWVEQESIHIRACDKNYRDAVEITPETARQLAQKLNELANLIDR